MGGIVELFATQEFFVDGFTDFECRDGLLTCTAFRLHQGTPVSVFKIVIRACAALNATDQAVDAIKQSGFTEAVPNVRLREGVH